MIRGITFTSQIVKSDDDGSLHDMLLASKSGIIHGCTTTSDANNIYIGAGRFIVRGRMIEVQGTETITPSAVLDGTKYCCLVFEIDLTKINTTDTFNQGYFKVLSDTSAYPTLTQQDINTGGDLHQYLWAKFTQTSQGIADFSVQANTIEASGVTREDLANYLPLSGGTINGAGASEFGLKNNVGVTVMQQFINSGGVCGWLGFRTQNEPIYRSTDGVYNRLLHTGNSSPANVVDTEPTEGANSPYSNGTITFVKG